MQSFLRKIYCYTFFNDLILIYPFYVIMFKNSGLSALQIGVLLTVWSITTFVLEIPSGVLADKYSRKHILFYAEFARILGFACWLFFPSFWGFLVGFILWGIKTSFASGTFEALVFDELKEYGKENEYTKIIGRARGLAFAAMLIVSLGAALTIQSGYALVLIISMSAAFAAAISIMLLPAARKFEVTHKKKYTALLREGVMTVLHDRVIFQLIFFLSIVFVVYGSLEEFWPIYGEQVGLPLNAIALFCGLINATSAIASTVAHYFKSLSQRVLYLLLATSGVVLVISSMLYTPLTIFLIAIFIFLCKIIDTVLEGRMQSIIPTQNRATITSVKSFLVEVEAILIYLSFGYIAKVHSYQSGFLTFGWIIIFISTIYFIFSFKKTKTALA